MRGSSTTGSISFGLALGGGVKPAAECLADRSHGSDDGFHEIPAFSVVPRGDAARSPSSAKHHGTPSSSAFASLLPARPRLTRVRLSIRYGDSLARPARTIISLGLRASQRMPVSTGVMSASGPAREHTCGAFRRNVAAGHSARSLYSMSSRLRVPAQKLAIDSRRAPAPRRTPPLQQGTSSAASSAASACRSGSGRVAVASPRDRRMVRAQSMKARRCLPSSYALRSSGEHVGGNLVRHIRSSARATPARPSLARGPPACARCRRSTRLVDDASAQSLDVPSRAVPAKSRQRITSAAPGIAGRRYSAHTTSPSEAHDRGAAYFPGRCASITNRPGAAGRRLEDPAHDPAGSCRLRGVPTTVSPTMRSYAGSRPVVERDVGHRGVADEHWREARDRRDRARAPDLHCRWRAAWWSSPAGTCATVPSVRWVGVRNRRCCSSASESTLVPRRRRSERQVVAAGPAHFQVGRERSSPPSARRRSRSPGGRTPPAPRKSRPGSRARSSRRRRRCRMRRTRAGAGP